MKVEGGSIAFKMTDEPRGPRKQHRTPVHGSCAHLSALPFHIIFVELFHPL